MKIVPFQDISEDLWDSYCEQIGYASLNHLHYFLKYLEISYGSKNISFASFDDSRGNQLVSICPLFLENRNENGVLFNSLTIAGCPLPSPLFRQNVTPSQQKRDTSKTFDILAQIIDKHKIAKILFRKAPLHICGGLQLDSKDFLLLLQGYSPICYNSLVMNLRETDEQLNGNLSQSHRKKIRKSKKGAQVVEIFDHLSTPEVINKEFSDYQALHLKAAGKMTRPQESFDFMRDLIKAGKAVLFTNKLDNKPLSSLYCDYYNNIARGWSQANDKDYEKEYSPRHLTEWEAMLYFKSKGIDYYEVGSQFTNGQISTLCNNKLLGIATFKERFGSNIYPEIHFEKYLDKNLFISTFNQRINDFCELNFKP